MIIEFLTQEVYGAPLYWILTVVLFAISILLNIDTVRKKTKHFWSKTTSSFILVIIASSMFFFLYEGLEETFVRIVGIVFFGVVVSVLMNLGLRKK